MQQQCAAQKNITGCLSLLRGSATRSSLKKGDPAERTSLCAGNESILDPAAATRVTSEKSSLSSEEEDWKDSARLDARVAEKFCHCSRYEEEDSSSSVAPFDAGTGITTPAMVVNNVLMSLSRI